MAEGIVLEGRAGSSEPAYAKFLRQRVYIFPSRHGLIFALLLLVMLLGAVNYNNSMAYVLVFLLGSLFMMCMLHTYKNLRGLVLDTATPTPVFAGETAHFPILLDNRAGPARVGLELAAYPKGWPTCRSAWLLRKRPAPPAGQRLIVDLAPGRLARASLALLAMQRGRLALGRLRISSTYPLGLFRAWSYMPSSRTCLVYPRPAGTPMLPRPAEFDRQQRSGNKGGTDDFAGFRQYRPGDSIRSIDWKALARERGLLVKRFSGSGSQRLILSWEQAGQSHDIERGLSQLCLWVLEAEAQGHYYGLELPEASIAPGAGEAHQHRCLERLAGYGMAGL